MQIDIERLNSCPVCGDTRLKEMKPVPCHWIGDEVFGNLHGLLGLSRCMICGFYFTNPRPSSKALQRFYDGDTYSCHTVEGTATNGNKARYILEQIAATMSDRLPKTLLDYGCGSGCFLAEATKAGWKVQGFEPGRRGLDCCLKSGFSVSGDLHHLPQRYFSVITMNHVFEHLSDYPAALGRVEKLLAPGGLLSIEVPNIDSLRSRLSIPFFTRCLNFDERFRAFPIHLSYFNLETITSLLRQCGWAVERTITTGLGIEEIFLRQQRGAIQEYGRPRDRRMQWRRTKQYIKQFILGNGLGENLCVMARTR
jgi:SAM-dependent methyltransferase